MKEAIPYHPELDAIDWRVALRRAKHAIVGHVPLILASIGVAFIVLVLYVKIFPPIYQAEAVLQGEPNDDVIRSNYYSSWNVFRKGDLKSEPELVTSGLVARTVVTELGLKFNDVHHTFLTQVGYLWTDSWLGKNYRAFKDWLFPDPAAYKATPEQIEVARTVDAFKESVSVEGVPGTAIARVIVKAPTFRVADYANKVVEVYLSERSKVFSKEADTAFKSLSEEVRRAEADLAALDLRKFDFDSKNKVVLDFEKDKLQVASWSTLQATMSELKATIASVEASLEVVQRQVKSEPREIIAGRTLQDSKVKSMLQQREFDLSSGLKAYEEKYVPTSPEVMETQKLLEENAQQAQGGARPDRGLASRAFSIRSTASCSRRRMACRRSLRPPRRRSRPSRWHCPRSRSGWTRFPSL